MSPHARFSRIGLSDTHPTPTRLRVGVQRRLPHRRTAPVNPLDSRDKNGARSLRRMRINPPHRGIRDRARAPYWFRNSPGHQHSLIHHDSCGLNLRTRRTAFDSKWTAREVPTLTVVITSPALLERSKTLRGAVPLISLPTVRSVGGVGCQFGHDGIALNFGKNARRSDRGAGHIATNDGVHPWRIGQYLVALDRQHVTALFIAAQFRK